MRQSYTPKFTILATVLASLFVQGCQTTSKTVEPAQPVEPEPIVVEVTPPEPIIEAEPNLSTRERFAKALTYLETGESDYALAELKEFDRVRPNNSRVINLIEQIETPASEYFPEEFFTLTLESGQSLSTLSKKYLGSALYFYALAKYNEIENPRRVLIGQEIKIPNTQLASQVRQQDLEAPNDEERIENAEPQIELVDTPEQVESEAVLVGQAEDIIDPSDELALVESQILDNSLPDEQMGIDSTVDTEIAEEDLPEILSADSNADSTMPNGAENTATVGEAVDSDMTPSLDENALNASTDLDFNETLPVVRTVSLVLAELVEHSSDQDYSMAMGKLDELRQMDGFDLSQNTELVKETLSSFVEQEKESQPQRASAAIVELVDDFDLASNEFSRWEMLDEAARLDPSNIELQARSEALANELAEKYHRQASSAFRRQELDAAISDWDLVLVLEPEHENAKVFRAQAVELQERLQELKQ
ncbi:LysM peptidoglycan-binding domain-containing protein [Ningiella sp. W23]|uniref:LysM peptidoglycan-binding domain-containing protein n=1 Tax=Ningiella sp. W23 TaxID=3023715 RepID=UPI0037572AD9